MKQRGPFKDAIANLLVALKEVKTMVIKTKEGSTTVNPTSDVAPLRVRSVAQPYDISSTLWCQTEQGRVYVYDNPLLITDFSGNDLQSLNRISFYIMFNLSLSHHLQAVYDGNNNEDRKKSLLLAKRLYELTYQLQGGVNYKQSMNDCNLVITAALLNNLSVVHESLGNEHEATLCQQSLLSALLLLVDMGEQHFLAEDGYQSTLDGFMGNVIHLMSTVSPVAKAA